MKKKIFIFDVLCIQIDFESTFYLASIDIQGHKYWTTNYYVTYYKVEYKTKYQDDYTLYEDKSGISEVSSILQYPCVKTSTYNESKIKKNLE